MSRFGLHLRLTDTLDMLAQRAIDLQLRFFQCFFVRQETSKLAEFTDDEIQAFVRLRHAYFDHVYLHGSYWINLASVYNNGYGVLQKELMLAKKLAFTHIILHPGSARGSATKMEGIDVLARMLNTVLFEEHDIQLIMENTAHGGLSIGSDITDFYQLLQKIDAPERIKFCIDTSHAYAYGYDIADTQKQDQFILLLDEMIGIERIALLHMNDTQEKCGSRIDRHAVPGQGRIGIDALQRLIMHPRLKHIPVLMELPVIPLETEKKILDLVRTWDT